MVTRVQLCLLMLALRPQTTHLPRHVQLVCSMHLGVDAPNFCASLHVLCLPAHLLVAKFRLLRLQRFHVPSRSPQTLVDAFHGKMSCLYTCVCISGHMPPHLASVSLIIAAKASSQSSWKQKLQHLISLLQSSSTSLRCVKSKASPFLAGRVHG